MATFLPSVWSRAERGGHSPFMDLHREIDRLLDDFHHMPTGVGGARNMMMPPAMDMCETAEGLEITAELPGVEEKDIDLSLENDVLTLKGQKKTEHRDDDKGHHMEERMFGTFQRSIMLPFSCDPGAVKASFENGVLRIMLPKPKEGEARSHKIPIGKQTGSGDGNGGTQQKTGSEAPRMA